MAEDNNQNNGNQKIVDLEDGWKIIKEIGIDRLEVGIIFIISMNLY